VGQKVRVNERDLTVIGVAPREFQGTMLPLKFELWAPATLAPALLGGTRDLEDRSIRAFLLIGVLRPGARREEAQAEFSTAMAQLARDYPEASAGIGGEILPFWDSPRGPQRMMSAGLAILQGVMLLLLLAVCGNTANLMLARGSTRQREMPCAWLWARDAGALSAWCSRKICCSLSWEQGLGAAIAVWGTTALRVAPMIGAFPIRFQTRVDELTLAFAILLGCCVRFDFQRGAGGPSGTAGSTGRASRRFQHPAPQPCAQSSDGGGSRTCDGRPDRGGAFLGELSLSAPNGSAIPARGRFAGRLRLERTESR